VHLSIGRLFNPLIQVFDVINVKLWRIDMMHTATTFTAVHYLLQQHNNLFFNFHKSTPISSYAVLCISHYRLLSGQSSIRFLSASGGILWLFVCNAPALQRSPLCHFQREDCRHRPGRIHTSGIPAGSPILPAHQSARYHLVCFRFIIAKNKTITVVVPVLS
jgi:hypothetical protein